MPTAVPEPRQHVPRPPGWQPGPPLPWEGLTPERRRPDLAAVRSALADAPAGVGPPDPPGPATMAAALVPIYEEGGLARVVLIRRSPAVPVHAGEVSFPGGRVQPGEREVAAALREAHEEVGLDPAAVEVVARLPTVTGVTSGTTVAPFVGLVAGGRPGLRAEPAEVDAVLDVALADLLAPGSGWEERWDGPGGDRPMWFFRLDGDVVWGMTARVLHHLLGLVTGRTAPPPPAPPLAPAGTTPPAPA